MEMNVRDSMVTQERRESEAMMLAESKALLQDADVTKHGNDSVDISRVIGAGAIAGSTGHRSSGASIDRGDSRFSKSRTKLELPVDFSLGGLTRKFEFTS